MRIDTTDAASLPRKNRKTPRRSPRGRSAKTPGSSPSPAFVNAESTGLLAVRLLSWAQEAGGDGLIHVAASQRRAEALARALKGLAPTIQTVLFPPWDCLPYDRASPSPEAMGLRMAALRRLAERRGPCLVVTVPDAVLQRVPPREAVERAGLALTMGAAFTDADREDLETRLRRLGYRVDERVDVPGEVAFRGQVVDLFPAGAARPYRLEFADGRIDAIRPYDPATQQTDGETESLRIDPASEIVRLEGSNGEEPDRFAGMEHGLPRFYPRLETVFDYRPEARVTLEPGVGDRWRMTDELIRDAYGSRRTLRGAQRASWEPLPPERLYLQPSELAACLAGRSIELREPETDEKAGRPVPPFAMQPKPNRAFASFLRDAVESGRRLVLAAPTEALLGRLARRAKKAIGDAPERAADWAAVRASPKGSCLLFLLDLDEGFKDDAADIVVIAAGEVLDADSGISSRSGADLAAMDLMESGFTQGDVVIHLDYGLGILSGLETVSLGDGGESEAVRLAYKDDDKLVVPVSDLDRIWRYGSEADAVSLDRLHGDAWPKRRARIEADMAEAAKALVDAVRSREKARAPKLAWPKRDYERFSAGFSFAETPDQARAIGETLADLAATRPMNRIVCGDVGYGKTEVALRAAAAAALAGKQVAVVAPTTVLVRQHLQTFRRRFVALGIAVDQLSRLITPAEARRVKQGLKDGGVRIVVGTHALVSKTVQFKELGLVIVDEEHRFGAAQKQKLQNLAKGVHLLTLTATPIPRTLQAAMVGLQDLSLIATPPARRRPIRTFLTPFDPVTVREALLREERRGGQSFLVCPRIEDIAPMAARLGEIAPELEILTAHGKMPATEIDETMVRFADGEGDVLLATNIIESGLDVPRANTMLVWRADRFGLAQLHQLRGRVGRGKVQAVAYLLTDPGTRIGGATRKRLQTLEALDRLGSGFAISAQDLDLRGAGELMGDEQAGHVKLIGAGLYRHLLERALRRARGEPAPEDWSPTLNLGTVGRIPDDYVPEPDVRIDLYARLARIEDEAALDRWTEELEDRFGVLPDTALDLVAAARLKQICRRLGIARVEAGPKAIALTFQGGAGRKSFIRDAVEASEGRLNWSGERLILAASADQAADRAQRVEDLLTFIDGEC
jgi:transcription-repair coupling factor (superfamily II helicase)